MSNQNKQDKLDPVALAQSVKAMYDNMPAILEFEILQVQRIRARYVALLAQGFDETQAIELCKAI